MNIRYNHHSSMTATTDRPSYDVGSYSKHPLGDYSSRQTMGSTTSRSPLLPRRNKIKTQPNDPANLYSGRPRLQSGFCMSTGSIGSRPLPPGPGPVSSGKVFSTPKFRTSASMENTRSGPLKANHDLGNSSYANEGKKNPPRKGEGYGSLSAGRRSKSFSDLNSTASYEGWRSSPINGGTSTKRVSSKTHNDDGFLANRFNSNTRDHYDTTMKNDYKNPHVKTSRESTSSTDSGFQTGSCRSVLDSSKPEKTRKDYYSSSSSPESNRVRNSPLSSSPSTTTPSPSHRVVYDDHGGKSSPGRFSANDGLKGLRNLGNTCFMNSVLQCLSHTKPLTDILLTDEFKNEVNNQSSMSGRLVKEFAALIKSMWKSGGDTAVSPSTFKTQIQKFAPRFMGYSQQDAQEFLRFLLEGLHDDLNRVRKKNKSIINDSELDKLSNREKAQFSWKRYLERDNSRITDVFVGQLRSTLKCMACGHCSVTFDPFWDLSLPIPRSTQLRNSVIRRSSLTEESDVTLIDCLRYFTKEETLDGDERPTCEKCKKKQKSTKKFTIERFPRVLVLHLKRFSGIGYRSKLQTNVEFPLTGLELQEFHDSIKDKHRYKLIAVSNHMGGTYSGHYTAYCKHPISQEWHVFNDARVDTISSSRIQSSAAYVLFYELESAKSSL